MPLSTDDIQLTARQAEVLRLVACGVSNPEIARRLAIRPRMVKGHLKQITRKLGSQCRLDLMLISVVRGWVTMADIAAEMETRTDVHGKDLTPRQIEVACLIACGLTNREAARRLNISPLTVKGHVCRSVRKLQIGSRFGLVLIAIARGWVGVDQIDAELSPRLARVKKANRCL